MSDTFKLNHVEMILQSVVVVSYLFGALLAGALIVHKVDAVALLPFTGVALAFAANKWARP